MKYLGEFLITNRGPWRIDDLGKIHTADGHQLDGRPTPAMLVDAVNEISRLGAEIEGWQERCDLLEKDRLFTAACSFACDGLQPSACVTKAYELIKFVDMPRKDLPAHG